MDVPSGLSGGKKTQVTAIETAINTALLGLNPNDPVEAVAIATLRKMRKHLELLKVERTS